MGNATVVKILDFGLASFASEVVTESTTAADNQISATEDARRTTAASPQQLTQMGVTMGTPDYIAPEQAEDAHTADIRADIYSLGCTFYTLLTGRAPFDDASVVDKLKAHREQQAAPLSDYRDDVPAEVEAIVMKMIAKNPGERFQTPAEVCGVAPLGFVRLLLLQRTPIPPRPPQ